MSLMEEKQSMFHKVEIEIAVYSLFDKRVHYFHLMPRQPRSNDRGFKCTNVTGKLFKKSPSFGKLPRYVQCLCSFDDYWPCHVCSTVIVVAAAAVVVVTANDCSLGTEATTFAVRQLWTCFDVAVNVPEQLKWHKFSRPQPSATSARMMLHLSSSAVSSSLTSTISSARTVSPAC